MISDIWRNSSSRFKRLLTILAFFVLSVTITAAGALTPLSLQEATELKRASSNIQELIEGMDVTQSTVLIFGNNFRICLLMFVPFVGPFIGTYVLYNTGTVIAASTTVELAENETAYIHPIVLFAFLFIFPFTWLEFIAYSTAFAASVWLSWRIIQKKATKELPKTGMFIALCAALLLAGAVIEAFLLKAFING
ncbi:MAG: stage II sporulation protein M [Candidatus Bathyarchaeia archaeon]